MRRAIPRKPPTRTPRLRKTIDTDLGRDRDTRGWTPERFARAVARRGLTEVPRKVLLSLRIDADVIVWFRGQGPGYQSRMNALLRAYMEANQ